MTTRPTNSRFPGVVARAVGDTSKTPPNEQDQLGKHRIMAASSSVVNPRSSTRATPRPYGAKVLLARSIRLRSCRSRSGRYAPGPRQDLVAAVHDPAGGDDACTRSAARCGASAARSSATRRPASDGRLAEAQNAHKSLAVRRRVVYPEVAFTTTLRATKPMVPIGEWGFRMKRSGALQPHSR